MVTISVTWARRVRSAGGPPLRLTTTNPLQPADTASVLPIGSPPCMPACVHLLPLPDYSVLRPRVLAPPPSLGPYLHLFGHDALAVMCDKRRRGAHRRVDRRGKGGPHTSGAGRRPRRVPFGPKGDAR